MSTFCGDIHMFCFKLRCQTVSKTFSLLDPYHYEIGIYSVNQADSKFFEDRGASGGGGDNLVDI